MRLSRVRTMKFNSCIGVELSQYHFENEEIDLPFPFKINLPIEDLIYCNDSLRNNLDRHIVWNLKGIEYVELNQFLGALGNHRI